MEVWIVTRSSLEAAYFCEIGNVSISEAHASSSTEEVRGSYGVSLWKNIEGVRDSFACFV